MIFPSLLVAQQFQSLTLDEKETYAVYSFGVSRLERYWNVTDSHPLVGFRRL
jgi:hypothetical protein